MQFNSILFPAPENCYQYRRIENIVYIPNPTAVQNPKPSTTQGKPSQDKVEEEKTENNQIKEQIEQLPELSYIPCLYLPHPLGSNKLLIFFHGNAEDIGWAYDFVNSIRQQLKVHVLAVEYPGYSLYIGTPNADRICKDAEVVYDYLTQKIGIPEKNILLFGRSIGSGPSTHLAARRNPAALILMSAYTSIGAVVKGVVGNFGKFFVAERFKNIDEITKIKCSVLLIHGMLDKLIPKEHSVELLAACPQTIGHIVLSENMTHNEFEMEEDIILPIQKFLKNCEINIVNEKEFYKFPAELYEKPKIWEKKVNKRSLLSQMYDKFFE